MSGDLGAQGTARPEDCFDALVIGAGSGGMAAAARLNHYGYRTLLVESRAAVGGRASTVDIDGFKINTGALVIEQGGDNSRAFDELGVDMGTRIPKRPLALKLGNRIVPVKGGLTGTLMSGLISALGAVARNIPSWRPSRGISAGEWAAGLTQSAFVHGLLRNLTTAVFACEPGDVEAAYFFDYFTKKNALKTYAVHPAGIVGPWQAMADHFVGHGGTLWLNSTVESLTFDDAGLVNGAVVHSDGETRWVATKVAVSNAGPLATVQMCPDEVVGSSYRASVHEWSNPSTLITLHFASRTPMIDVTGVVFFGPTRRLSYAANVTDSCPEMAPPGWHLYQAACTPHPATGIFDLESELELLTKDLREHFHDFDSARIITTLVTAGDHWPAQRAVAGRDLPQSTPVANLWNVGDGVREWATGGQSACVETARLVTDVIRDRYPATTLR